MLMIMLKDETGEIVVAIPNPPEDINATTLANTITEFLTSLGDTQVLRIPLGYLQNLGDSTDSDGSPEHPHLKV